MTATTDRHALPSTTTAGHDDLGSGEPAVLFIPGWCADRWVFDDLAGPLAGHRRVLVADLPAHGSAPTPPGDFGAAEVVDHLVTLLDDTGVERVVPVALSHAGWFAIELRRRLGAERVPGLALLDWMVLGTPPGFADSLSGLQSPHSWQEVRAALARMWTAELEIPRLHDYVRAMGSYGEAQWGRAGREIAAAFDASPVPLEALAALAEPPATLHLYAQPADDGYLAAQQAFSAAHAWFTPRRLNALSHFPMFEVPDEMSREIEDFMRRLADQ